jgi:hypothetical protein
MTVEPFTGKDYLGIVAPVRVRSVSAVLGESRKTRSSTRTLVKKFIGRTETATVRISTQTSARPVSLGPLLFRSSSSALFTDVRETPFEFRTEVDVLSRNMNGLASRFASHRTPKRKQVYCDFAVDFFRLGYGGENFPSPETLKFKAYFRFPSTDTWSAVMERQKGRKTRSVASHRGVCENFLSTYVREVSGDGGLLHSYFAIIF